MTEVRQIDDLALGLERNQPRAKNGQFLMMLIDAESLSKAFGDMARSGQRMCGSIGLAVSATRGE
jgi:hypothetical protein